MAVVIARPLDNFENVCDNDGASMSTNVIVMMKISTYFREKIVLTWDKNFKEEED